MDITHAREIIRSLADGRDPATGIAFPPDSPYQQPDTIRALYTALAALDSTLPTATQPASNGYGSHQNGADSKPHTANSTLPRPIDPTKPQAGKKWTPEEEARVIQAFTDKTPIADIAAAHGRTPGAITSRLVKLGLIEDPAQRPGVHPADSPEASPCTLPTANCKLAMPQPADNEYPF